MARCACFVELRAGEVEAEMVFEDETSVAFLDVRPLFPGHVLLVTREHFVTLPDLPNMLVGPFFQNAQRLVRAVQEACAAPGCFVAQNNVVSQSVPHLHVHIVPRRHKDGLKGFFWPRTTYASDEARRQVGDAIRRALGDQR